MKISFEKQYLRYFKILLIRDILNRILRHSLLVLKECLKLWDIQQVWTIIFTKYQGFPTNSVWNESHEEESLLNIVCAVKETQHFIITKINLCIRIKEIIVYYKSGETPDEYI
jgi:hypothetical protein